MIRISTIFIAICMVLVAASLGLILYSVAGISGMEIPSRRPLLRPTANGIRLAASLEAADLQAH